VTSAPTNTQNRASARDRLLQAANELFYAEGVQTVGIDRIIERAGVAKASLYNHFASKEELVAAYLASRHDYTADRIVKAIEGVDDPRQKILAVFDSQAKQYEQRDFHGCAFIAACAEAPSGGLVEKAADEFRAWIRNMFTDLAAQAGAVNPTSLGRQLHLIYDGAGLAGRMDHHDPGIRSSARHAVETLLDAALASRNKRSRPKVRASTGVVTSSGSE
jgi:AcrR family transcriptional regulator